MQNVKTPDKQHIWVFAEHSDGEIIEHALELICEGRKLAERLKGRLCALILGHRIENVAESIADYGVETVFIADDERFDRYRPECFTAVIAGLAGVHVPDILLFGSTVVGQDLAPRVAAKLRTCLAANCDRLQISEEGLLLQTRLAYRNKLHTTVVCPDARPQTALVAPGVTKVKKASKHPDFSMISIDPAIYISSRTEKIEPVRLIKSDPKTIDITDAEMIVSGGKGVDDEEGFKLIHDLADALGAAVAGSRPAVDNRWIGRERQIGQSGKTVSPVLMISCGISGASAHTFGMRDTKNLIAINTDKTAPIMKFADLGVAGDLRAILPELISRLKETV
ncbi:MAG: electron transfer flavoprotein subunit alpha/FixB family protein [Desulfobacterales bacterium]